MPFRNLMNFRVFRADHFDKNFLFGRAWMCEKQRKKLERRDEIIYICILLGIIGAAVWIFIASGIAQRIFA